MLDALFDPYANWPDDWEKLINVPLARRQIEGALAARPIPGGRGPALADLLGALGIERIADPLRRVAHRADAPFDNRAVATFCLFRANLDARFPPSRLADLAELVAVGACLAESLPSIQEVLPQILSLPSVDAPEVVSRLARHARPYAMPGPLVWNGALMSPKFQPLHAAILDHLPLDPLAVRLVQEGVRTSAILPDLAERWLAGPAPEIAPTPSWSAIYVHNRCPSCHGFGVEGLLPDGVGGWTLFRAHLGPGHGEQTELETRLTAEEAELVREQIEDESFGVRVSVHAAARTALGIQATDVETIRLHSLLRHFQPGPAEIGDVLDTVAWTSPPDIVADIRRQTSEIHEANPLVARYILQLLEENVDDTDLAASLRQAIRIHAEARAAAWLIGALPPWSRDTAHYAAALRALAVAGRLPDFEDLLDTVVRADLGYALLWAARDPEQIDDTASDLREIAETYPEVLDRRGWTLGDLLLDVEAPGQGAAWAERVFGLEVDEPLIRLVRRPSEGPTSAEV